MCNGERDGASQGCTCHPDSMLKNQTTLLALMEFADNSNISDDDVLGRLLSFVPDLVAGTPFEAEVCHSDRSLQYLRHLGCHSWNTSGDDLKFDTAAYC